MIRHRLNEYTPEICQHDGYYEKLYLWLLCEITFVCVLQISTAIE
jgi:hypothetical protein